jgi:hypothetical protein
VLEDPEDFEVAATEGVAEVFVLVPLDAAFDELPQAASRAPAAARARPIRTR